MTFDDAQPIVLSTHVQDWRDEIIYQVLVDRFANGDAGNDFKVDPTSLGHWHGGDWKGVEDHLDYIQALGVTTIWISPVVKNVDNDSGFDGYHGYWTQDLGAPNPHFGDVPALRRMVAAAHAKGLKVILDIVVNHLGQLFYYDINSNGQPDVSISGGGCNKWDNPADTQNSSTPTTAAPTPPASSRTARSGVEVVSEYDPEFDPVGPVQSFSSLGYSGPAPVIFLDDPGHQPRGCTPQPASLFTTPDVFQPARRHRRLQHRRPAPPRRLPRRPLGDLATYRCDVKQGMVDAYATWVESWPTSTASASTR